MSEDIHLVYYTEDSEYSRIFERGFNIIRYESDLNK
jgi:hypothetical protein